MFVNIDEPSAPQIPVVPVAQPELSKTVRKEDNTMSDTSNFFANPMAGGNAGWGAGVGGLIGAAIGNGGLFGGNGGREPSVTPDQLQASLNSLQAANNTDALQEQIGDVRSQIAESSTDQTFALGAAISGVKDAVTHASSHNQLALCALGHSVQTGFASVNQAILMQGAASRELALQQALDVERARATELRISLGEAKNAASHTSTQVLLQQIISAK